MEVQYQRDTYTPEEISQMFKKRKRVKKKKSKRVKIVDPTDSIPIELREEMTESEKLRAAKPFEERYDFLQKIETTASDRGKRSEKGSIATLKQKLADSKAEAERKLNYRKAREKAETNEWLLDAVEEDEEEMFFRKYIKHIEDENTKNIRKDESLQATLDRIKKSKLETKKSREENQKNDEQALKFTTANVFAFGLRGAVSELTRYNEFSDDEETIKKKKVPTAWPLV
eukprot:TRINITY_DN2399_c0_g1_i1.p1 TRINITY_DN2399_c0_g1~~TRINITY_DN2399_c0_g1_i1.p1  ORF type:complete len:229 (+),score=61.11 TRINITY_DN2399_c0_g1_i1:329-1015(+)